VVSLAVETPPSLLTFADPFCRRCSAAFRESLKGRHGAIGIGSGRSPEQPVNLHFERIASHLIPANNPMDHFSHTALPATVDSGPVGCCGIQPVRGHGRRGRNWQVHTYRAEVYNE
jgi:hypothetical protein